MKNIIIDIADHYRERAVKMKRLSKSEIYLMKLLRLAMIICAIGIITGVIAVFQDIVYPRQAPGLIQDTDTSPYLTIKAPEGVMLKTENYDKKGK